MLIYIFKKIKIFFKKVLTVQSSYAKIKYVLRSKFEEQKSTLKSKQYPLRNQAVVYSTTKIKTKNLESKNSKK